MKMVLKKGRSLCVSVAAKSSRKQKQEIETCAVVLG
jgi:hypothetical protein